MAIKDLQPRQGKIDIVVEVTDKSEPREFEKFGRTGRVCSAKVRDASGEMTLTLWNDEIDKVEVGNTIHIINGYVSEFQGEMQLTAGRFGKIELVEAGKTPEREPSAGKEPDEKAPKEKEEETDEEDSGPIDEEEEVEE